MFCLLQKIPSMGKMSKKCHTDIGMLPNSWPRCGPHYSNGGWKPRHELARRSGVIRPWKYLGIRPWKNLGQYWLKSLTLHALLRLQTKRKRKIAAEYLCSMTG